MIFFLSHEREKRAVRFFVIAGRRIAECRWLIGRVSESFFDGEEFLWERAEVGDDFLLLMRFNK